MGKHNAVTPGSGGGKHPPIPLIKREKFKKFKKIKELKHPAKG